MRPPTRTLDVESLAQSAPTDERPVSEETAPVAKPLPVTVDRLVDGAAGVAHGVASDAPLCMSCGTKMRMAGSCFVCEGCGSTSGCS